MGYAVVGTLGTPVTGAFAGAASPAWGASENRTAGNLLIAWVTVTEDSTIPATPSTWSLAIGQTGNGAIGGAAACIYYKISTGGEAAPTFSTGTGTVSARLGEFSGNASSSVLDQTAGGDGGNPATSPKTITAAGVDLLTGELLIAVGSIDGNGVLLTITSSHLFNNATSTESKNDSTNTQDHYNFSHGITTANASADNDKLTWTGGTSIADVAVAFASFKLPAAGGVLLGNPQSAPMFASPFRLWALGFKSPPPIIVIPIPNAPNQPPAPVSQASPLITPWKTRRASIPSQQQEPFVPNAPNQPPTPVGEASPFKAPWPSRSAVPSQQQEPFVPNAPNQPPPPAVGFGPLKGSPMRRIFMAEYAVVAATVANIVTASDTLTSLTESVSRVLTLPRAISDTLTALTETVARVVTLPRAITDTLTALTETLARTVTLPRAISDTLTNLTDTATKSAQAFLRTATETLTALTETATRTVSLPRTVTDTLTSLTETATGIRVIIRNVSDTLTAPTDSVTRILALTRTLSDNPIAISESTFSPVSLLRVIVDNLGALIESATAIVIHQVTIGSVTTFEGFAFTVSTNELNAVQVSTFSIPAATVTASQFLASGSSAYSANAFTVSTFWEVH